MALFLQGSRGEPIKSLQSDLNACPSELPILAIDGIFGPKTRARVIEFQKIHKITADGIVGPVTLAFMAARKPMTISKIDMVQIMNSWRKTAANNFS